MGAFRETGNVSKERQRPSETLEHLKMWNEFMCQFRHNVTVIQHFFLPTLQERDLDSMWLQQYGTIAYTSRGVL
ncbi:hypothetical protein TNCV_728481 [Trichonephila clavipes]|nr:hypothetical protein TNCV_728481 [Trichonephila clavipes]